MERTITYQISESEHGLRVEQYLRHKGYSYQNLQTAGFDILVDNLPALLLIFSPKFALLGGYAVELKTSYRDGQRKAGVFQVH